MTGPIDAELYVSGRRIAGSAAAFNSGALTVLTDAAITWGRGTALDQPEAATASFKIAQRRGRAGFLRPFRVGAVVDLVASAWVAAPPAQETFRDGGFEQAKQGSTPEGAYTSGTGRVVRGGRSGQQSLQLTPNGWGMTVVLPPAKLSTDPAAWDHLPATAEGQRWRVSVSVMARVGQAVTIRPVLFASPEGHDYTVIDDRTVVKGHGTAPGAWQDATLEFNAPTAGRWVGVQIRLDQQLAPWRIVPGAWNGQSGPWLVWRSVWVDDISIVAPDPGQYRRVLAFRGRITDQTATYDQQLARGSLTLDVTAKDFTADLENQRIGSEPWPVETIGQRVERILKLAGGTVTARIAPSIAATKVTWRDVDSQPAHGLIRELAESVAGVAWSATHDTTGAYYQIEDPAARLPLLVLGPLPDGKIGVQGTGAHINAAHVPTSDIPADPVAWTQDVADIATRAVITWHEQTVNDKGKPDPTERRVTVVNAPAERLYGQRGISLSTQLQAEIDARNVGGRLLARTSSDRWRVEGLTWDTGIRPLSPDDVRTVLDLLDGTRRNGAPLMVTGMPVWAPTGEHLPVYIEGGTYTYTEGRWRLEMTGVPPDGQGDSITWREAAAAWRWADIARTTRWHSLIGVGRAQQKETPA